MFANPEVSAFIDRLIGGQTPHGGAPPPTPGYRGSLARSLLGDLTLPRQFGSFSAPAIRPGRGLEPSLPSQGVGRQSGSGVPGEAEFRGGGGNTGASGLASGLQKLGAGAEGGLDQFAANKQAADEKAALAQGGGFPKWDSAAPGAADQTGTPPMFARPNMGAVSAPGDIVSYIRNAAAQRGIDPDIAVKVAKSEGLASYTGDNGSSFGPFQLHYGGVVGGGNAVTGLGDTFTKTTGLDARDPSTVKQQIDFSLDQAAKGGWGPWHGAANSGIGNFEGIGAPSQPALGPQGMLTPPQGIPQPAGVNSLALALAGGQMPVIDPAFGGGASGLFG